MSKKITDKYKRNFFKSFGEQIAQARQEAGMTLEDLSEISGFSKLKLTSIEGGGENRLLRLQIGNLLNLCQQINRKIIINLVPCSDEDLSDNELPDIKNEDLLKLIASRIN